MMLDLHNAQHLSLTMQVELRLKHALIAAQMAPGERLNTRDIAEEMHVSITPVREAVLRLVAEGALCIAPAQAFTVPKITRSQFDEIALIRKELEGVAIQSLIEHQPLGNMAQLAELSEMFNTARDKGDAHSALQAQREFRFALYEQAQLPLLLGMIEQLWIRVGPCFHFLRQVPEHITQHRHSYDALLEAIKKKDVARAQDELVLAIEHSNQLAMTHFFNAEAQS
ncbi:FCD domain-containing protein [Mangrovibacter plantisponsor]|nr:FCD domain-containing protein [Mangrovibacter plantisponsor]